MISFSTTFIYFPRLSPSLLWHLFTGCGVKMVLMSLSCRMDGIDGMCTAASMAHGQRARSLNAGQSSHGGKIHLQA